MPSQLHPLLEDAENQVLFLEPCGFLHLLTLGGFDELGHRHLLQLGNVDVAIELIAFSNRCPGATHPLGGFVELFCNSERLLAVEFREQLGIDVMSVWRALTFPAVRRVGAVMPRPTARRVGHDKNTPGGGKVPVWLRGRRGRWGWGGWVKSGRGNFAR